MERCHVNASISSKENHFYEVERIESLPNSAQMFNYQILHTILISNFNIKLMKKKNPSNQTRFNPGLL